MLTTDDTYSINRGRAQNSNTSGSSAPTDLAGFFISTPLVGSAANIPNKRACLVSRFELPTPYGLREQSSQKGIQDMQNQLVFKGKALTPVILNNQPFLTTRQVAVALYKGGVTSVPPFAERCTQKLYNNHADEFTPDMSFLTTIDTPGGKQQVRVFSLRGCHLLAMFSKTPVAKEFRRWVLDLIEQHNTTPALPDMKSLGGLVKSCAAAAMRAEFGKAMTDMVYTERFKSIIREALKQTVDDDFEFGVWKDIVASSLAARCSNMVREKEKQLRQKIAAEIMGVKQ